MTDYYVAMTGNDSNPGTSGFPFLTVNRGVLALATSDRLIVRAGTYPEVIFGNQIPSGVVGNPTIVMADGTDVVWLKPTVVRDYGVYLFPGQSYVTIDGINVDGTNNTLVQFGIGDDAGCTNITVKNLEVIGCFGSGMLLTFANGLIDNCDAHSNGTSGLNHGIYFTGNNSTIRYCRVSLNAGYGIHHSQGSGQVNNIIHNNRLFSNGSYGMIMNFGSNGRCYNNISYNNGLGGFQIAQGTTKVFNNTSTGNVLAGFDLQQDTGGEVRNNIIWNNGSDFSGDQLSTFSNNLTTNPLFVNQAGNDYHLQSGSPARDAGFNLAGQVDIDFDNNSRPQNTFWDIGAYEFVTGGPSSKPHYYWRRRAA